MFADTKAYSGFAVDDVQKAREFYGETLGLRTSVLDEETFLTSTAIAESGIFRGYRMLLSPGEEPSAHALRVNDTVFVPAHFPRTADLLAKLRYAVKPLEVAEIRKLDAGLPCMSLRWSSGGFAPGSLALKPE